MHFLHCYYRLSCSSASRRVPVNAGQASGLTVSVHRNDRDVHTRPECQTARYDLSGDVAGSALVSRSRQLSTMVARRNGSGSTGLSLMGRYPHRGEDRYVRQRRHLSLAPVKDCLVPGSLDRSSGACPGSSPEWKRQSYSVPCYSV